MTFRDITLANLKYNAKRFASFFFVNSFVVAVLFMYGSLLFNDILNKDPAIQSSQSLIVMAACAILIFSVMFLTYTGIYFIKSRGREFGVYLTLGMTASDLSRMVIQEYFLIFLASSGVGVAAGLLFSRLFYLALAKVLAISSEIYFISYKTFLLSVGVFFLIFLCNIIFIHVYIRRMTIMDIMKSEYNKSAIRQHPIAGIVSCLVFAASLWLFNAMVTGDDLVTDYVRKYPILIPAAAVTGILLSLFFIMGSAITGIGFLLKKMPAVYHRNLLLLSGLSHKFRAYRISLFTVTLLISFAVLFIGIGMSFYSYTDMSIQDYLPFDIMIDQRGAYNQTTRQEIERLVRENGGEIEQLQSLRYLDSQTYREFPNKDMLFVNYRTNGYVLQESEYNRLMKQNLQIAENELVIVYNQAGLPEQFSGFHTWLTVEDYGDGLKRADAFREQGTRKTEFLGSLQNCTVLQYEDANTKSMFAPFINSYGNLEFAGAMGSVIDDSVFDSIAAQQKNVVYLLNLKQGDEAKIFNAIEGTLRQRNIDAGLVKQEDIPTLWKTEELDMLNKDLISHLRPISKAYKMEIAFRANSFLLFSLSFLGILFLISSCIVLYYKIISDADEEMQQVNLLKRVGMTNAECRSYLQNHLAILFFAPLLLGGLLGLNLVNDFLAFTSYSGLIMLRVFAMYSAVALFDIVLYMSLRKRFFREVRVYHAK